ncbi:hypothetical protein FOA52_009169 [Chlamydomonas sp. UWO 241]|nr:hypothetical protein FOA52_009169 [Chlamydomonas sp. UWO 241]
MQATERRLTGHCERELSMYRAAAQRLSRVRGEVVDREDAQADANARLEALHASVAHAGESLSERAEQLDGGARIQGITAACARLCAEMAGMDVRLGVVASQLLAQQMRRMVAARGGRRGRGGGDSSDED